MAQEEDIKYFVRISNTDLDGTKPVHIALTGIRGVGMHTAQIIASLAKVDEKETMGRLKDEEVDRIREIADTYTQRVPSWMMNRPKDVYTGESKHLLGTDVSTAREEDINLLRKIRCYRGIRHETGQKVRGQRTKSTGRTGLTVGVKKKKE
ncbi:MAG TPA: 30S ribosomal protein S13 [Methanoregulaceae archaeon]|nr:30S ribosomal protein S13 [Methanoregulaceae archaeon]HPX72940.1 30S ribosomal protein S13 [Methanoregulaceae archaeon]HQA79800.1 30S ribosomal protein S13 [Methanoregulaceae archaeon]